MLIHHLTGPPPRELDALATMTWTPAPWGVRDALIVRLPMVPRDVAMSEVSSWPFYDQQDSETDVRSAPVLTQTVEFF